MKIYIHSSALSSDNETLLTVGALFGMKYLQEAEYDLSFDPGALSESQLGLIENELIINAGFDESAADGLIKKEEQYLFLSDGDIIESAHNWTNLTRSILFPTRKAKIKRDTKETTISVSINLDGTGESNISTGLK